MSAGNPSSPQVYKSRIRTEPTNITAPQFSVALWARLEAMFQEMADCCIKVCILVQRHVQKLTTIIKVYGLEKVLKMKKDPVTHVNFLDEVMKV